MDGTNIERNLYLSTQILELGIPVIMAVNMIDIIEKTGDKVHLDKLSKKLGCEVVAISALKGTGITEAANKAVTLAKSRKAAQVVHEFQPNVEAAIKAVEDKLGAQVADEQKRFFAIKLLEKDDKIGARLQTVPDVSAEVAALEKELDDDTESIITNERYVYISSIIGECVTKNAKRKLTTSDKIDKVVTNRWLALPIFAVVMFIVYYVSVTTVGTWATDWANDGVFGDGWHLFAIGSSAFADDDEPYVDAMNVVSGYLESVGADNVLDAIDSEADDYDAAAAQAAVDEALASLDDSYTFTYGVEDEETLNVEEFEATGADVKEAATVLAAAGYEEPDPADYGVWVPGIPALLESGLDAIGCADWLKGLILDGIVAGVGAVLGFVPQMLVLFIFLAFLESCGYMARIAFIMDRIFRKFGLSGKSFIPMLIGSGCGVPGIMASRTIENDRDRKMTIMTTTFIPCGAKLPFIAMVAGAIFGGAPWVAPSAYFLGIFAIICSGIILKKTKIFEGDPAPFVMELPAYHMPTVGTVLRSMWERGWSFIKKAGTIILLSTIIVWFTTYFGFTEDGFRMLSEDEIDMSILGKVGQAIAWIFVPQGFGNWQATVASITGLVAKENIVGTMGILYSVGEGSVYANMAATFTLASGYAFLAFNLLCAPCFAAMGAIKREMNSTKWFWIAVGYQCGLAYLVSLVINNVVGLFTGESPFSFWTVVAFVIIVGFVYLLVRPYKKSMTLKVDKKIA